jgi:AraC-like DNA-binding protein
MKPVYEHVFDRERASMRSYWLKIESFPSPLHFHPVYEIVLILKGKGTRYIGDNIESFEPGDLVLLDGNLPHFWFSSNDPSVEMCAESIVIQFGKQFVNDELLEIQEFRLVNDLLSIAGRGVKFDMSSYPPIFEKILEMPFVKGVEKISKLYCLLDILARHVKYKPILSEGYFANHSLVDHRVKKVKQYCVNNFKEKITLQEAAEIAGMQKTSFCRYFKESTGQSFVGYLTELRLIYTAKLLQEDKLSVTQACFESGFCNISNFNRRFKEKYKTTPLKYRRKWHVSERGCS